MAYILNLNIYVNRHPNIIWIIFLKSASKIDLEIKNWELNYVNNYLKVKS